MKVTTTTTTVELAREINRHPGFRATVWGRQGLRRVHIKRFRYNSQHVAIDESFETESTIYVEFKGGAAPLLTVKEADMMTKNPEWECRTVSYALSRIGVHVDCKPSPVVDQRHFVLPHGAQSISTGWTPCDCLN